MKRLIFCFFVFGFVSNLKSNDVSLTQTNSSIGDTYLADYTVAIGYQFLNEISSVENFLVSIPASVIDDSSFCEAFGDYIAGAAYNIGLGVQLAKRAGDAAELFCELFFD